MLMLAPSILSADFLNLGEEIRKTEEAGCKYLHFDVMDGMFVPSISFGMPVLKAVRKATEQFLDVHLMIMQPERYVEEFVKDGADLITIHVEACDCIEQTLHKIHALGIKAGISLNPDTPVEELIPYLSMVDLVLVMTVEPGFGGQKYRESCTEKIKRLVSLRAEKKDSFLIEVDGGINRETFDLVLEAGAEVLVAGSAVFNGNTRENAEYLMEMIKRREKENNK